MSFINNEIFNKMMDELLNNDEVEYQTLIEIVTDFLKPKVSSWFRNNLVFSLQDSEDFMQDLLLHFISVTTEQFFLSKNDDGNFKYQRNTGIFCKWMETHAKNKFLRIWSEKKKRSDLDLELMGIDGGQTKVDEKISNEELLKKAFAVVLSSGASPHIVFTWILHSFISLHYDITRIKANDIFLEKYSSKTIADMYIDIIKLSDTFTWLKISDEQHKKILAKLQKEYDEECRYGDVAFEDFFMSDKGEKSGKKSVSNWIGRMDDKIVEELFDDRDNTINPNSKGGC